MRLIHDLLAAIDPEHLGGDEAVVHQVHGAERAVLRMADPAHGQAFGEGGEALFFVVGVQDVIEGSVAEARCDGVDPHAEPGEL